MKKNSIASTEKNGTNITPREQFLASIPSIRKLIDDIKTYSQLEKKIKTQSKKAKKKNQEIYSEENSALDEIKVYNCSLSEFKAEQDCDPQKYVYNTILILITLINYLNRSPSLGHTEKAFQLKHASLNFIQDLIKKFAQYGHYDFNTASREVLLQHAFNYSICKKMDGNDFYTSLQNAIESKIDNRDKSPGAIATQLELLLDIVHIFIKNYSSLETHQQQFHSVLPNSLEMAISEFIYCRSIHFKSLTLSEKNNIFSSMVVVVLISTTFSKGNYSPLNLNISNFKNTHTAKYKPL